MVNEYMLDKVLDKIKEIKCIVNFDDIEGLTDTDDKLPDYITLKNVVILITTCVIKNDAKFYPQILNNHLKMMDTCQKMRKTK